MSEKIKKNNPEKDTPEKEVVKQVVAKEESTAKSTFDVIENTKKILQESEQTLITVPLSEGETPGAYETVSINGYKYVIRKGDQVRVPVPVAKLIAEKYRINLVAGQDKRIDRNRDVTQALG